ncbi:MAG: exosortase A, partial [Nitrosospira sp.]
MNAQTPQEMVHDSSETLDQQNVTSAALLTLATITAILVGYHETTWSMVSIWERSDTFAHGFLIFPFSAYLIWGQRKYLRTLCLQPNPVALSVLGLLGFSWLLATLASVQVFAQFFLIAMIPAAVWAILGNRMVWAIAFPLAYLLLAVPFGEALIPPLIDFTADFTVKALQLTGIPVYREGSFFSIPSGNWSVVEACSGLRYLIASFTLGTLYAYMTYRSLARRLAFIAL